MMGSPAGGGGVGTKLGASPLSTRLNSPSSDSASVRGSRLRKRSLTLRSAGVRLGRLLLSADHCPQLKGKEQWFVGGRTKKKVAFHFFLWEDTEENFMKALSRGEKK